MKKTNQKLIFWLKKEKPHIASSLAMCGSFIPRIKESIEAHSDKFDEYVEREISCLVDYMVLYFSEEKEEYKHLYVGERLKMSYDMSCSAQERSDRLIEFMRRDKQVFTQALAQDNNECTNALIGFFDSIMTEFKAPIKKEFHVLFIGDCIHQDVMGSLSVLIMQHGVALAPHMISTKNIFQLHGELKELKNRKFDVVFYSPLSYEYNLDFSGLIHYRNIFMSGFNFAEALSNICKDIEIVADRIISEFDCPVFIHNTAGIIRDESRSKLVIKFILGMRLRQQAVKYIDKRIRKYIKSRNSSRFKQLFLLDELDLLKRNSLYDLGKYIYKSALQHPTKFGMLIAHEYNNILFVLANLYGKKLIVCDLDNTLWDGVIGEGQVEHFVERQNILLRLKSKGVLLAINSKNDSKNVRWEGGVLSNDDFVYKAISWSPKVNAFSKMQSKLNLKIKDFIFIDDREDELDLVGTVYPLIKCLDALNLQVWTQLELWETLLDDSKGMDRTQMYKEREDRGDFLNKIDDRVIDEAEIFNNLKLVLSLREVKKSEIKRAVELVNRTNQFNMRGSRVSFNEVELWLKSEQFLVLQASMSDKFGDMGVVSIIVLGLNENSIKIPVFVLSCRVFGYKVEVAILNEVKRIAALQKVNVVIGEYIETASNLPCSTVYSEANFITTGSEQVFNVRDGVELNDPEWLEVAMGKNQLSFDK